MRLYMYAKRDDFDFFIDKFPFCLCSNIPESPGIWFSVSLLIWYARVCLKYANILCRRSILVSELLKQGYSSRKLQTTFRKLFGRHTDLVHQFDTFVSLMLKCFFRDGCHMWGRKCSLFLEHLISLPLGVHDFTHSLHIHYRICQSWHYVL